MCNKTMDLKFIYNKLKLSVTRNVLLTNSKILDSNSDSMDMNLSNLWETGEDRGAWYTAVHGVAKSWTQLSGWTMTIKFLVVYKSLANNCLFLFPVNSICTRFKSVSSLNSREPLNNPWIWGGQTAIFPFHRLEDWDLGPCNYIAGLPLSSNSLKITSLSFHQTTLMPTQRGRNYRKKIFSSVKTAIISKLQIHSHLPEQK